MFPIHISISVGSLAYKGQDASDSSMVSRSENAQGILQQAQSGRGMIVQYVILSYMIISYYRLMVRTPVSFLV